MATNETDSLITELDNYLKQLKREAKENAEKAREEARISLISSGVLDNKGKVKEHIVKWGY